MKSKGVFEIPITQIEVIQGLLPRIYNHTIEEKIEEYKEAMEAGEQFPPIVVWDRNGHYWLIDGMHRLLATKRLGKETIKAEVVELADELEARMLAIERNMLHGIPLSREEKQELARLLYADGVEIEKLKRLFRVSERTIYNWVQGITRRKKDEELKRRALELRKQGLSQQEVAERLGIDQKTVSNWERDTLGKPAKIADFPIANNSQLLTPDGTPTQEGFKALSEFMEEHEEELREKPFNEVVKEQALRDILKFLNEALRKDFKRFIDSPSYEKIRNYLMGIHPYKELSIRARKLLFDKAQVLWEGMKKEHEERKKLEEIVIEKAKEILLDPEYQFSTWKNLRFELSRRGIHGKEELIDEILHGHADELLAVYKQIPEPTEDSLSEEEINKIKEEVKEEKERWAREYKTREAVRRILREKGLRILDSVVERVVKKVEELVRKEEREELERIAKEIEERTPEEEWEKLRKDYEEKFGKKAQEEQKQAKAKEKQEKSLPPPSIEEWYRKELKGLLLKMGLALTWPRAFEIAEEVLAEVKEESKTMLRGW
jgi:ParB-like chromosome segregation protein Spo0J